MILLEPVQYFAGGRTYKLRTRLVYTSLATDYQAKQLYFLIVPNIHAFKYLFTLQTAPRRMLSLHQPNNLNRCNDSTPHISGFQTVLHLDPVFVHTPGAAAPGVARAACASLLAALARTVWLLCTVHGCTSAAGAGCAGAAAAHGCASAAGTGRAGAARYP